MYPRSTGHCYSHHIPQEVVTPIEDYEQSEEELQLALQYLRENQSDLVKGDLVIFDATAGYRNNGVSIFDGVYIINLDDSPDEYGNLPQQFRVIEDGVPITYWEYVDDTDNGKGVDHNLIVWFDHSKVLQQCLSNIGTSDLGTDTMQVFTTFTYDGKDYRIVYQYPEDLDDSVEILEMFRTKLRNCDHLCPFDYRSQEHETLDDGNTLFMTDPDY